MGKYSIKDVETLSGVKAHTLRIWEQRYKIVVPKRTETNIRYYTDEQLRLILNIALLNKQGIKISKLADLEPLDIEQKVGEMQISDSPFEYYINLMISSMIILDHEGFSEAVSKALDVYSFEKFCSDIVFPFLKKIGVLWLSGGINPAQEHFASNILKRKVIIEIDKLNKFKEDGKEFLLFLPEGEFHELSLLISEYIILNNGHNTHYFGSSLPVSDLKEVLQLVSADYIFCVMLVNKEISEIQSQIETISKLAGNSKVMIAGIVEVFKEMKLPSNIHLVEDINSFSKFVKSIK